MKNDQGMKIDLMSAKDGSKDPNMGMITLKVLFFMLVIIASLFATAQTASAYTEPYKLVVFTDKQAYLDYAYIWTDPPTIKTGGTTDTPQGSFNQRVNLFVVLLDSDGNIVRGIPAANFSAALRDVERWNHSGPGLATYPFYTVISTGGTYYNNISFPAFTDADSDGIFNSTNDVTDTLSLSPRPPLTDHLNISINVTVNYNGTAYKTNVSVMFGNQGCRHDKDAGAAHGAGQHDGVVCTVCHWGYQYILGAHGPNNSIMKNDPARWKGVPPGVDESSTWDYKLGTRTTTLRNQTTWDNSNASFCLLCHGGTVTITPEAYNIADVLNLFSALPSDTDQNDDTLADNNRPSCSWYRGPRNGTGGYPVCHGPQAGLNGSTNITGSQLYKVDWNGRSGTPGQSKSHNHSNTSRGVPCELCHAGGGAPGTGTGGQHMVAGLPNRTTTDYTNINTQCNICHNITGGLNITSNGGSNIDHNSTDCRSCHQNDTGVLDSHLVPVAGGPDCLSCHDYGKTASQRINNSAMNSSNASHARLNNNSRNTSDVSAQNKKCWGCHSINGSQPGNTSMGNRYDNPYKCYDCHNATSKPYANASTGLNVSEHFKGGAQIIAASTATDNSSSCLVCHNLNELKVAYTEDDSYSTDYSLSSHYARNRTDLRTWNSSQAVNCSYCHQNASTAFAVAMLGPAYNSSIQNHSAGSSPVCFNSTCHGSGWIHNSTLTRPALPLPNSTYCQLCHAEKQKHNGTQDCTLCHINTSSNDTIHPIKYLQTNGGFITSNTSAVNCSNCHQDAGLAGFGSAPMIPNPLKHSSNISNGTIWGAYWNWSQSSSSSCYYCHNNTKHNSTALGKISAILNSYNVRNGSLATTQWCADCHYNDSANTDFKGSLWNPDPPYISYDNTFKSGWIDHSSYFSSGYNDSACNSCHALNGSYASTSLNYSHSLDPGMGGGPNCIICHNLATALSGGAPVGINFTTANASSHNGTNSNNATLQGFAPIVGACWACHDSDGNVTSGHPDRYKDPKTCTECHLGTGTYNASAYNALIVAEHYSNGSDIKAGNSTSNISSCINCHENVSEMILYNNDTDYGSFTGDGIRLKGGNMSFYHYGKNRTDMRTGVSANCSYCHQNSSTAFAAAMTDPAYNKSISNHSNYSSNPNCTSSQCHNTGWMHNSTLAKPTVNSTFCLSCHGSNGAGGTNYTGAVTGIKERHNNSLNCSECHLSTVKDVHPVKYLQEDATYSTLNTSSVTCVTCHQTSSVDAALTLSPPKIPATMRHSDNTSNGTIWNSTAYWTPASPLTSCTFCHNDTKHNATAFGRPAGWQGNNVVNSSLTSGAWCSSCHYKNYSSGAKNYSDMTQVFTSANLSVPPEITNGSYAINIYNRSNYYNHSLTDYSDSVCRLCHGVNLSSTVTISELMHNVSIVNTCTVCHYSFEAMNNTTRPDRYVDFSMYNTSLHRQLSCADCHTQGHRNMGARKACEDCHAVQANPVDDKDRHNITATPSTYFVGGNNVVGITDCTICHNGTLYNRSISTYGYWKPKDCDYCHTYPDKYYE